MLRSTVSTLAHQAAQLWHQGAEREADGVVPVSLLCPTAGQRWPSVTAEPPELA